MTVRGMVRGLLLGLLPMLLAAQPVLHLKSRRIAQLETDVRQAAADSLWVSGRSHLILQFAEFPRQEEIRELEARGAQVLDYVPDNGLLVSAWDGLHLEGLNLHWAGRLETEDKLSPSLEYLEGMRVVVEFHRDVTPGEMRAVALRAGLTITENPDLLPVQLLVSGSPDQIWGVASRDEVAYIYPASTDLVDGTPVRACVGPLTDAGTVGQYTSRTGNGWDGPGKNAAEVRFSIGALTASLPPDVVKAEIRRAMDEWSRVVQVDFPETNDHVAKRSISILFGKGSHGDGYPFDGPGGTLAHTFYPAPPNPEPIAGDLHLDDEETYRVGADIDLYTVVLHELGHALGLGHSDLPGAVMYPFYRQAHRLTPEDIQAVQELYAARDSANTPDPDPQPEPAPLQLTIGDPATTPFTTGESYVTLGGTVSGGEGAVKVLWASDRGGSGETHPREGSGAREWSFSSVQLALGANRLTVAAVDAMGAFVTVEVHVIREEQAAEPPSTPEPPVLTITAPGGGYRATSAALRLAGTAHHASGIALVEWVTLRGAEGVASGKAEWSAWPVPLETGVNVVTVTAWSNDGRSISKQVVVEYEAPTAEEDTTAPSITINAPASGNVSTRLATAVFRGFARDDKGVVSVTWSTSGGSSGTAPGTAFWGPVEVPLLKGANTITIRARDAAGNVAWRTVHITRR